MKDLQLSAGFVEGLAAIGDGDAIPLLLGFEGLLARAEVFECLFGSLKGEHHFLLAAELQPFTKILILTGFGAVFFEALAARQQLLLNDSAAVLPLLHVVELAPRLFDARIEQSDTGKFINEPTAIAIAHRHDAGDIALHHDVAPLRIDAQTAQLGLELLEVAGHPISGITRAVGAAWHHPQLARHGPFLLSRLNPGTFRWCLETVFRRVGYPVIEVEPHAHRGFGCFSGFKNPAIDQVWQPIRAHSAAVG